MSTNLQLGYACLPLGVKECAHGALLLHVVKIPTTSRYLRLNPNVLQVNKCFKHAIMDERKGTNVSTYVPTMLFKNFSHPWQKNKPCLRKLTFLSQLTPWGIKKCINICGRSYYFLESLNCKFKICPNTSYTSLYLIVFIKSCKQTISGFL